MRIDSAQVGMESARLYTSSQSIRVSGAKSVSTNMQTGSQLASFDNYIPQNMTQEEKEGGGEDENKTIDEEVNRKNALQMLIGYSTPAVVRSNNNNALNKFQKLHEMVIKRLFDMLFKGRYGGECQSFLNSLNNGGNQLQQFEVVSLSKTLEYEYTEYEEASFSTQGTVLTSDGRELSFNINVSMSRSFYEYASTSHVESFLQAIDPLVINLDTDAASISDQSFFFDLECTGQAKEYKSLGFTSGFLALDKNLDGIINDGSELFGANSGDGFKDLARYDEDGNGWIDENDSVFELLKIWVKDEEGNDFLYGLKDKNVGAIYLGNVDTQFSLTASSALNADAIIRKTGFFLYEDGSAGTVQHVDLVS